MNIYQKAIEVKNECKSRKNVMNVNILIIV